jgi:hypothetical protein
MRIYFTIFILFSFDNIFLNSQEIGCLSSIKSNISEVECSSKNPITGSNKNIINSITQSKHKSLSPHEVNITKDLLRVEVKFKNKVFSIGRIDIRECPPFCISSFKIKGIKGVGELETIDFIKSLEKKKGRILVDARAVGEFEDSTIPTAINIPYSILEPKSKYKKDVLKLLGAVELKKGWYFKRSYRLLIFDNGILDNRARKLIDRLLKYGYPKSKILYYRGGFGSWKSLGLTVI